MGKYSVTATLSTPNYDEDEDVVYSLDLDNKGQLHKIERGFVKALVTLNDLTEREITAGAKHFSDKNPQLTVFDVMIKAADGSEFSSYTLRWPNQSDDARAFLQGLLDGIMKETGHQDKKVKKDKKGGKKA